MIGEGTVVDNRATLGEGVRFMNNMFIPQNINLSAIFSKPRLTIFGQYGILLTEDVLSQSAIGGILGAINSLPLMEKYGLVLLQETTYGFLQLKMGAYRYSLLPRRVRHILKRMVREQALGVFPQANGQITFVTQTGREVIADPVIQAPDALQEALRGYGLTQVEMLDNGNLKIPVADGLYFIARANLYSTLVPSDTPLGLNISNGAVYLIFEDDEGARRQQFIYPAAANPDSLYALAEDEATNLILTNEGKLTLELEQHTYQGQLDYVVTPEQTRESDKLQMEEIDDVNGDQCDDYRLHYGNGESQVVYCMP
jgi:hypothetical protein